MVKWRCVGWSRITLRNVRKRHSSRPRQQRTSCRRSNVCGCEGRIQGGILRRGRGWWVLSGWEKDSPLCRADARTNGERRSRWRQLEFLLLPLATSPSPISRLRTSLLGQRRVFASSVPLANTMHCTGEFPCHSGNLEATGMGEM